MFWLVLIAFIALVYLVSAKLLTGPDLSHFDDPAIADVFAEHPDDAAANAELGKFLLTFRQELIGTRSIKKGFAKAREFADNLSADLQTDSEFRPVTVDGVHCEWTLAPNSDDSRRILFMHGGAFFLGSPKGHRRMTDRLSKLANAAVLSVDYSMLPERGRKKGIVDCQKAYQWILEQGPNGAKDLSLLLLAGDSAGGNLALMLSSWSGLAKLRRPDGVIGFSPSIDVTMSSPTYKSNLETDPILKEGIGKLLRIPPLFRNYLGLMMARMNPANPLSSPIFNDLSDLPRTLIHASSSEMLLGESIRYANKARAAGSDVRLQVWKNQVHDWHLFNMGLGSAEVAWAEVEKFVDSLEPKKIEGPATPTD